MADSFSIVALPFLKTSGSISLGGVTFRSTEDRDGLTEERAAAVTDVSRMLFVQDDFRVKSACYAFIPKLDLDRAPHDTAHLEQIHSVIAYLYSSPHEIFGTSFLHTEHASLVVFTPTMVLRHLTRPAHNVVSESTRSDADEKSPMPGYAGLYNFRHHFWVERNSRIYGPIPNPVLNLSQDLAADFERARAQATYRSLLHLLHARPSAVRTRMFTALRWHAAANHQAVDEYSAIVDLSIAFEALLGLPQSEKTDRLVDAIALLLGRTPRLDMWARQFYDARSRIVHEGRTNDLRFAVAPGSSKSESQLYQSLLSYGSHTFRLCLGTLLVGMELADRAGLAEKFVTNQERYSELCRLFGDRTANPMERLEKAVALVETIERYQFVGETGLQLDTMLGAVRAAALTLVEAGVSVDPPTSAALNAVTKAKKSKDRIEQLEAVRELDQAFPDAQPASNDPVDVVRRLTKSVWGAVFMHYYWLKKRNAT